MELFVKEASKKVRIMEKDSKKTQMVSHTMEISKMEKRMEKESTKTK